MTNVIPLTEVREKIGELVSQAYYKEDVFGISKGKTFMGAFVSASIWKEMVRTIERHAPGLADSLALMADPQAQQLLIEDEHNIRGGNIIPWERVIRELEEDSTS